MHVIDHRGLKFLRDEVRDALEHERRHHSSSQEKKNDINKHDAHDENGKANEYGPKHGGHKINAEDGEEEEENEDGEEEQRHKDIKGDNGNWLQRDLGNRIRRCIGTPETSQSGHRHSESNADDGGGSNNNNSKKHKEGEEKRVLAREIMGRVFGVWDY